MGCCVKGGMIRVWALAAVPMLLAGTAVPGGAQSVAECQPTDTARVAAWHSVYDTLTYEQQLNAMHGVITIEASEFHYFTDPSFANPERFVGRYDLTIALLSRQAPDWVEHVNLTFRPAPDSLRRLAHGGLADPIPALVGYLQPWTPDNAGTPGGPGGTDSVEVQAAVDTVYGFRFAIGSLVLMEDGGGFTVTAVTSTGFRGRWSPGGYLWPPDYGYFCAERVADE